MWLEQLCRGDFAGTAALVSALHLALDMPADEEGGHR
jgi:hypothetical protein